MADQNTIVFGGLTYKTGVEVYYVDVSNNYKPELQAKSADAYGNAPSYTIGAITYKFTNSTMINSDSQVKRVYFPPFESGLGKGDFGRTPQDPLNWHQFLAHLRFKKYKYPRPGSNTPIVTSVVYKLTGTRVLVDEYEHEVGNGEFGYDIPIGFDPSSVEHPAEYNFSYIWEDTGVNTGKETYALPQIVITSTTQNPWALQFNDLNGLALRFLSFGTDVVMANGMLQTVDGEALDVNSDIVFERLIYNEDKSRWLSVNDAYYGYTFGGLVWGEDNISNYPWLPSYNVSMIKPVGPYAATIGSSRLTLDNMWITASGYIGFYMHKDVNAINSTIRADYTFSTYKNNFNKIEFSNDVLVSRDDSFEDFAGNVNKSLKPYTINSCVVCWKSASGGDPSGSYVATWGVNQFGYQRGVFVSEVQDYPPDSPPPPSIFTSAVSELAVDLPRISYLHDDFSGISLSAGNIPTSQVAKFLGSSYDGRKPYVESSQYEITYVATSAINNTFSNGYKIASLYSAKTYWVVDTDAKNFMITSYPPYPFENVWYTNDDSINSKSTYVVTRDGVGALYFPTFKPYSFSTSISTDDGLISDPVDVSVGDGSSTDFVLTYSPSYEWIFTKQNSTYQLDEFTGDNPFEVIVEETGTYDVEANVISNRGFYSCGGMTVLSYTCTGDADFEIVVTDLNGSVPSSFYAGRQYMFSATNTSPDAGNTIYQFVVQYGNNTTVEESNKNVVQKMYGFDDLGDFVSTGNVFTDHISFNDVYGWTTFAALAFGYDGSYILKTVKCFVEKQEDVYYVDLSKEYEDRKTLTSNTFFVDTFESGTVNSLWGNDFKSVFYVTNMWGDDKVAVTSAPGYVKLFNSKIGGDFDVKFSFVRKTETQDPTFKIEDGYGGYVLVTWNYLGKTLSLYTGNNSVTVDLTGYPKDLGCSNSLRHLEARVRRVGSSVYVSYKILDGSWSSESLVGVLNGAVDMYIDAKSLVGFGYFYATADSGLGIVNGQHEEYPLTFSEFRDRLNSGSSLYDKYLCRGYRVVSYKESISVIRNVVIDSWNSINDPITYGPWILVFDDRSSSVIDFTNSVLKNGIIYNLNGSAQLVVGSVYDMFVVWKGSVLQKYRQWSGSRFKTSNLIGSTINRIAN